MNNLQLLEKSCSEITEQIKKIGQDRNSNYVIDGIINPKKYISAKYRLLWILKEANSKMDSWSYIKNFKDKDWLYLCGKSIPTLRRIIYASYGILRACEWGDIPDAGNEKAFEPLEEIALINIKKIPGHGTSTSSEIQQAYYDYRSILKQQIDLYDADIVIFGNTMNYFYKEDFEGLVQAEKQITDYRTHFYDTGKKLYIHAWHPAARGRGFTDKSYVTDLLGIVKNWKKE
ncbi:hypothetical protein [Riemerella anatipestifer]|uniref:hypothetical protein n=1 Tax=Riemerella anatipestifer TaxID=34085 RepID=UPI0021F8F85F|nr:hypothetical protein [Riemerella anatipestifer]MCW0485334.1 hypothetical protein [Riemerella anatipestifer]